MAERLGCTFLMSFEETGDLVFKIIKNEENLTLTISAELEIKSLKSEKKELIKALKLWYVINMTDEGIKNQRRALREKNN